MRSLVHPQPTRCSCTARSRMLLQLRYSLPLASSIHSTVRMHCIPTSELFHQQPAMHPCTTAHAPLAHSYLLQLGHRRCQPSTTCTTANAPLAHSYLLQLGHRRCQPSTTCTTAHAPLAHSYLLQLGHRRCQRVREPPDDKGDDSSHRRSRSRWRSLHQRLLCIARLLTQVTRCCKHIRSCMHINACTSTPVYSIYNSSAAFSSPTATLHRPFAHPGDTLLQTHPLMHACTKPHMYSTLSSINRSTLICAFASAPRNR
jgi:hypothetical protein